LGSILLEDIFKSFGQTSVLNNVSLDINDGEFTAPFDVTGHPAMSVPCGMSEGLPVGMMLVGRRYEESTIYRAAGAFEAATDWKKI
tara:strand:- start:4745 stop:5002 length:258 start_codon:yes stop_codon:yes gene_type:complete